MSLGTRMLTRDAVTGSARGEPESHGADTRAAQAAAARRRRRRRSVVEALWFAGSIAFFVALWELAWLVGLAPELTLPPPHIFIGDFADQSAYFNTGHVASGGGIQPVLAAVLATVLRVLGGLAIGFVASIVVAVLITQVTPMRRLLMPVVTLLAPISPMAWLPISIIILGVGNGPALFMVFIGVFFTMTLGTIADINNVSQTQHNVARTLGATRAQTLLLVILPSIMPGLLRTLRLSLFAAWVMVLVAEAVGVGEGLGQVIMLARNTFNSSLVFLTMFLIGVAGFLLDTVFRAVERRILRWDAVANKGAEK
jgi:NitT/TauT family transport system permease protein